MTLTPLVYNTPSSVPEATRASQHTDGANDTTPQTSTLQCL